ncbi:MAG: putative M18 family aminopeptidase 2 [Chlamydiae bacterium]|nr:putative M18 family aminopeptidase 2 [Chlamydiota bacterium]
MSNLFSCIENSPSAYHTVETVVSELKKKKFKELKESSPFKLKKGERYYVKRDSGALIAFVVPQKSIKAARIYLSHTDSPTFRIKPQGEYQHENMIFWSLEVYGGPIYASWLNRDLGLAGRIFVEDQGKVKEELVHITDHPAMITQLPIHIDRKVNSEGLKISAQQHLNALATLTDKKELKTSYLEKILKKEKPFKKLLNHELFLCPLESPRFLGEGKDLFSAPRIDNLLSVYASVEALIQNLKSHFSDTMPMIYLANHEEIGSKTYSGADSPFFKSIFERIFYQEKMDYDALQQCCANSLALSLDGAHALDPKSPEQFEPRHTPLLGKGIAVKIDTGASYSYSNLILSKIQLLADKHKIKIQNYLKRGDQRQGSTLGPMFVEKTGIPALDLGCAQLSMHSVKEVASLRDYEGLVKLLSKLYRI